MALNLILKEAEHKHIKEICLLINLAYRGDEGWTKETNIIEGDRTTPSDIEALMLKVDTYLLVAVKDNEVISCICIEKNNNNAHIGLFAVHPEYQGCGAGKKILAQAENIASNTFKVHKFVMAVINQRNELISYYERRGYVRTGKIENYPIHLNVGTPKKAGLTITYLEKSA